MVFGVGDTREEKVPIDEVQRLAAAGRNEREIIVTLRAQGYTNEQISKALNRVLKFTVGGDMPATPPAAQYAPRPTAQAPSQPPPEYAQRSPPERFAPPEPLETPGTPSAPEAYGREMEQLPSGGGVVEMTAQEEIALEELIEEIIAEKWRDVEAHLVDLDRLYATAAERLDVLEQKINEVLERHTTEKTELKGMLTETTDSLQGLEGRIGAVERAFKDFLPALTDNVRELSRIVESVKNEEKTNKK